MAKESTVEVAKKEVQKIANSARINEAYLVGLLWSDPFVNYSEYYDTLSIDEFFHEVWGFYFELGRKMFTDGIRRFDTITVHTKVKEYNLEDDFKKWGGMDTIEDAVEIVQDNSENIEYYFESTKRNDTIKQLYLLFGEKVLIKKNKYDYEKMNREQLTNYWNDRMNKISLSSVQNYEAENLYIEADDFFAKLIEDSSDMLPFFNSYLMNSITQGVPRGSVTMFGGFGNSGKSSCMVEKFLMSCVAHKEKLMVVLNEEDAQALRQKLVLTIMFHEHHTGIDRKRMVNGKLQDGDKAKIRKAFERMHEMMDGDDSQIKVVFMNKYTMKDLEKIVRFWANRGYTNLWIDTHKVSEDSQKNARWETFVEDTKTIYRFTRKNAGGLNLRTLLTFQLADSTIKQRFLNFECMAEGKAAKNEASIVMMFRTVWSDEYEGGKKELDCYKLKKNDLTGSYEKEHFKLKKDKTYYLLFTPKNRTGANTDNGQPVMVMEVDFNFNNFKEIGWTFVPKDYS
jgi:replicative DNA helicase